MHVLVHGWMVQIWLKREELAHTGAHKINNAVGQALLAKRIGKNRIIAETGAGQHGVATATVCALLGMECVIYMGAVDCERQKLNVFRMKMLGAKVGSPVSLLADGGQSLPAGQGGPLAVRREESEARDLSWCSVHHLEHSSSIE